jgi:ABC-type antimicrobial peptide transport system permease subunit
LEENGIRRIGMEEEITLEDVNEKVDRVYDMLEAHGSDGPFICTLEGDQKAVRAQLEENRQNQEIIIQQNADAEQTQAAFVKSQDRMFRLIVDLNKRIENFEHKVDYELKKGRKRMDNIDDYIKQKNITNGYRDKMVDKLEEEVNTKASKKELEDAELTIEDKIDLLVQNSGDQLQAQKDFNATFWKVLTVFFVVIAGIVGILGLIQRI